MSLRKIAYAAALSIGFASLATGANAALDRSIAPASADRHLPAIAPVAAAADIAARPGRPTPAVARESHVRFAQATVQYRAAPNPNAWWASWPTFGATNPSPLSLGFAIGVGSSIASLGPATPGAKGHVTGRILRAEQSSRIILLDADDGSTLVTKVVAAKLIRPASGRLLLKFRAAASPDIDWKALTPGAVVAFDCRELADEHVEITNLRATAGAPAPANAARNDLVDAAGAGDLARVKALLAKGADVNGRQSEGGTALIYAAQKGHLAVVRALIAAKADVSAKMNFGANALMVASQTDQPPIVRALIAAGADVNAAMDDGATALMFATQHRRLEIMRLLLVARADVNAKRVDGGTALMIACVIGDLKVVTALLAANADVNARDAVGRTALTNAVVRSHVEVIRALLAANADVNMKLNSGTTALSLAKDEKVRALLTQAAAKRPPAPAAARSEPNDAAAFLNRGSTYDDKGDYDRAIREYDQAIRLDPNFALAFYYRGLDYANKEQYDRAIQDYDQALRINPRDTDSLVARGVAYGGKGQYDRAIQDYDEAIRLNPNSALAFYDRGLAYANKGQSDRAIRDYDEALRLSPKDADILYGRGLAKRAKGDLAGADADIAAARKLNPKLAP